MSLLSFYCHSTIERIQFNFLSRTSKTLQKSVPNYLSGFISGHLGYQHESTLWPMLNI